MRLPAYLGSVVGVVGVVVLSLAPVIAAAQGHDGSEPDAGSVERYRELQVTGSWEVPPALRDTALALLFEEIALLVSADALDVEATPLAQVVAAYGAAPGGDRATLTAAVADVDARLATVKGELLGYTELTPAAAIALDDLSPTWLGELAAGAAGRLDAADYVAAASTLLSDGTAARLRPVDRGIEFIDLREALARAGSTWTAAPLADAPGPAGSDPWPVVGLAATALVVAGSLTALLRRRRTVWRGPDLSDAVRELIGATDEADVAAIAVRHATSLTGAASGLLARPHEDGLRIVGEGRVAALSRLQHVVETGSTLTELLERDPGLDSAAAQVLAVPTVTAGRVVGVLAVHDRPGSELAADARHVLERLAPTIAAALANVDRLDDATAMALVDGLTSLGNRRRMDQDLDESVRVAAGSGAPVAFAMVDVDHFKHFNDTHGHQAGDLALCTVAATIAASVRAGDVVYRYGGEEFSILLPDADTAEAARVAERVRRAVEVAAIPGEQAQPGGRLTVSVGVAAVAGPDHTAGWVAEAADKALYEAKRSGRNRVVTA